MTMKRKLCKFEELANVLMFLKVFRAIIKDLVEVASLWKMLMVLKYLSLYCKYTNWMH